MIADTKIVNPLTREVIAHPGDKLEEQALYEMELVATVFDCFGKEIPADGDCSNCPLRVECYEEWEREVTTEPTETSIPR